MSIVGGGARGVDAYDADGPGFPAQFHEPTLEWEVIAALLFDNANGARVAEILTEDDFADPTLSRIYLTIQREIEARRPATFVTVASMFEAEEGFKSLGGRASLARWTGGMAATQSPVPNANAIKQLARRRRLWIAMQDSLAALEDMAAPLDLTLTAHDKAIADESDAGDFAPISASQGWAEAMASIRDVAANGKPRGLRVANFQEWNDITGGMHPGQFILLGGRPGMGKSSVGMKVAIAAAEAGEGVLFISVEMTSQELYMRIVADKLFEGGSRRTFEEILNGQLDINDFRVAEQVGALVEQLPLLVEDRPDLNVTEIIGLIRNAKRYFASRGQKLGLAVVDYLGLLKPPRNLGNITSEVTDISKRLKQAARVTRVPLLALAQLNRETDKREDKRPVISDLRDSGSLEQDADTICFVYREEYYLAKKKPHGDTLMLDEWQDKMREVQDRLEVYSDKARQHRKTHRTCFFFGDRAAVRSGDFYQNGGG